MIEIAPTLKAHHLPQLQGSASHSAELSDKAVHIAFAEHQAAGAAASTKAPEALTYRAEGHASC